MNVVYRACERYRNKVSFRYSMQYGLRLLKSVKEQITFYDKIGRAWIHNIKTGEVRLKTKEEIQHCEQVSLKRTYKKIQQILNANYWQYFITLTFNSDYQDRANDNEIYSRYASFTRWLRIHAPHAYYLFVVERQKDWTIHFHGLMGGASREDLQLVTSAEYKRELKAMDVRRVAQRKKPNNYALKWHMHTYRAQDEEGRRLYCFKNFCKYGKNEVSLVDDQAAVYGYISKYVVKSFRTGDGLQVGKNKKRYFVSRNVDRPHISKHLFLSENNFPRGFSDFAKLDVKGLGYDWDDMHVAFANDERNACVLEFRKEQQDVWDYGIKDMRYIAPENLPEVYKYEHREGNKVFKSKKPRS